MKNKRGLSTIVVTLIILVITLVSVGILYAIYTNILNQNKGQVDIQSKCLNAPINVVSATCVAVQKGPNCTIYLEKGLTASTVPDQVKFSFIDKNGLVSDEKTNSWSTSAITITDIKKSTNNLDSDITTVRVVPQFNVGGNYQDCAMIEKVI